LSYYYGGYRSSSGAQRKLQRVTRERCLLPQDRRIGRRSGAVLPAGKAAP